MADTGADDGMNNASVAASLSLDDSLSNSFLEEQADLDRMEQIMTRVLYTMRPARPDIVRAVRARRALWCCGRAFRGGVPGSFHASFPTGEIDASMALEYFSFFVYLL